MNKVLVIKSYVLLFSVIVLGGCASQKLETATPTRGVISKTLTASSEAVATEIYPVVSPATRETSSPANATLETAPPILSATMISEDREAEIERLLQPKENCRLPCWWGFIPGKVAWADVERFLMYMNAPALASRTNDGIHHEAELGRPENSYSLRADFLVYEDRVVAATIRSMDNFDLLKFQKDWDKYQPNQILKDYGVPSRVWIKISGIENNGVTGGLLWMFYDEQDFLIIYQTGATVMPGYYHYCPRIEGEISLFLQASDSVVPLDSVAKDLIFDEYIFPIEKAAGMTVKEFYSQILATGCFDTPKSIRP